MAGNVFVAIPSYKRPHVICRKTLATLQRLEVPSDVITVFVANNAEEKEYRLYLPSNITIRVGVLGLHRQRQFMQSYYPLGSRVVYIDDDIEDIYRLSKETSSLISWSLNTNGLDIGFMEWVRRAFNDISIRGLSLWGIYPVKNAYFMYPYATYDLRFIVGAMYGLIHGSNMCKDIGLEEKEDVERTLQYYIAEGGVARHNYITIKTRYYKEPNGMQSNGVDRKVTSLQSANILQQRHPELCRLFLSKKSGYADVRLKDRRIITKVLKGNRLDLLEL
jgi:hypothetical protein